MAKKRVVLEFTFEEEHYPHDDWTDLVLVKIERIKSDLTDSELSGLGEEIGQSDRWQVDNWNHIQNILGSSRKKIKISS